MAKFKVTVHLPWAKSPSSMTLNGSCERVPLGYLSYLLLKRGGFITQRPSGTFGVLKVIVGNEEKRFFLPLAGREYQHIQSLQAKAQKFYQAVQAIGKYLA